jgi:hypothetical protein
MMHAGYILWSAVPSRVRAGLIALGASQALVRVAMAFAVESLVRDGARALVLKGGAARVAFSIVAARRCAGIDTAVISMNESGSIGTKSTANSA